jgi:hypothetical protein
MSIDDTALPSISRDSTFVSGLDARIVSKDNNMDAKV